MGGPSRDFADTLWSLVLRARNPASPDRRAALDDLIRAYWKPVYHFIRRHGHSVDASKDFTQAFFTVFLEKDFLASVDRSRGRFKSFLIACLRHFLSKEYDRAGALKRGGGVRVVSFDVEDGPPEPAHAETPEREFARRWAAILVGRVMEKFRTECALKAKDASARALEMHLAGAAYADIAAGLGIPVKEVTNRLHRARGRLKELMEEEVRPTVTGEEELQAELREIFELL